MLIVRSVSIFYFNSNGMRYIILLFMIKYLVLFKNVFIFDYYNLF